MKRHHGGLPFKAGYVGATEYVICKGCPAIIAANELRLAIMTDTSMTNLTGYRDTNWYHFSCFFARERPKSVNDISDFHTLRAVHQSRIRGLIDNNSMGVSSSTSTPSNYNGTVKNSTYPDNSMVPSTSTYSTNITSTSNISIGRLTKISGGNTSSTPSSLSASSTSYPNYSIVPSTSAYSLNITSTSNTSATTSSITSNGTVNNMSSAPSTAAYIFKTIATMSNGTPGGFVNNTSSTSSMPVNTSHTIMSSTSAVQAINAVTLNNLSNQAIPSFPVPQFGKKCNKLIRDNIPLIQAMLAQNKNHTSVISSNPSPVSSTSMGTGSTQFAVRPKSTRISQPPIRVSIPNKTQQNVLPVPNVSVSLNGTKVTSASNTSAVILQNVLPAPYPKKIAKKLKKAPVASVPQPYDPVSSHPSYVPGPSTFVFRFNNTSTAPTVGLKVKNGSAVDHQSDHVQNASVYRDPAGNIYSAVLFRTDWEAETNSFHKIQVLECTQPRQEYWLFQSKGEVGGVGYLHDEKLTTLATAIVEFEKIFMEETGNMWRDRHTFKRIRGKKILLDILYKPNVIVDDTEAPSQLVGPVQKFIKLIHEFGNTERELESVRIQTLDLEKWPVGRINDSQIQEAYGILQRLEDDATDREREEDDLKAIIRSTNDYYSLIPRDFKSDKPRLLKSLETIQKEIELLDSLMITETKYSLIDAYYEKLNAELRPLGPEEVNFEILKTCLHNTYGGNRLEIIEIFSVERFGEDARFTPYKGLPNRKLLWHGSRLVNFSKILAQGLCIAPQGAQISGHSFGRGIYFSDMVAKSASYCRADSSTNNIGLLLLCEVALGNMRTLSRTVSHSSDPTGDGYDSVKAVGSTVPDPAMNMELEDGIEIALGSAVRSSSSGSAIVYNEFVVFNEAQVKIRYLIQAKF